jgi:hypothetical protein
LNDDKNNPGEKDILIQAWIENRMERDRTVLTLSSAGLGLLATLLAAIGFGSWRQFVVYIGAAIAFLISVFGGLAVFHFNSNYVQDLFHRRKPKTRLMNLSTKVLVVGFLIGIVLTLLLAFWLGISKIK